MKNKKTKKLLMFGLASILFLLFSTFYSIQYNESRLVVPTDFSTFHLTLKDIPMLLSIFNFIFYILYIVFYIVRNIIEQKQQAEHMTRIINPKLGILGFLGFLGFYGFQTYNTDKIIFPFTFFIFFGFFGFYYEGKMSDTLIDEMFEENKKNAALKAYGIGFNLIFLIILSMGLISSHVNPEFCAIFLLISISLTIALTLFLSEYFVYYNGHKEEAES